MLIWLPPLMNTPRSAPPKIVGIQLLVPFPVNKPEKVAVPIGLDVKPVAPSALASLATITLSRPIKLAPAHASPAPPPLKRRKYQFPLVSKILG